MSCAPSEIDTPGGRLLRLLWWISQPGGASRERALAIAAPGAADSKASRRQLRRHLNDLQELGFTIVVDVVANRMVRIRAPDVTFRMEGS